MLEEFTSELLSVEAIDFRRYREVEPLRVYSKQGCVPIFWDGITGEFVELRDFFVNNEDLCKRQFRDGSRIFSKGWMNIVMVGEENYYHLFPVDRNFGFCKGIFYQKPLERDVDRGQKLLERAKKIETSLMIDRQNWVFYEIRKFVFEEDPFSFDLFNDGGAVVLFKGQQEMGMIHRGSFHQANTALARTIISPLAEWWLNRN